MHEKCHTGQEEWPHVHKGQGQCVGGGATRVRKGVNVCDRSRNLWRNGVY